MKNKNFAPYLELMPKDALRIPVADTIAALERAFGARLYEALDPERFVESPLKDRPDTAWIKRANTVGVNVRTLGSFWDIIPYALTLPAAQQAIHILPIWEPGVAASLYGPCSWRINPEFYNAEWAQMFPALHTVERQLKATVNLLHLLGKAAGMDVVPHTDRYSEQALANPFLFEWLQRRGMDIVQHESDLYQHAEAYIYILLERIGSAAPGRPVPASPEALFYHMSESERLLMLFGEPDDYAGRLARRKQFIQWLYDQGLETVPATMAPPYRGLEVDPNPEARVIDEEGREWRDYRITRPEPMSRVFGPLARYRLYESKNNNRDWELDFERPVKPVWQYVCERYMEVQRTYGFDFMRGDMSHVQMRPDGVPARPDEYYDILGAVKKATLAEKPWFGYFAESFLAPPNEMAYGDECDHLEASLADSTLGDLQSEPVGTDTFSILFARYIHWLETRRFAPNFTIMTADKDDPRFDKFYLKGNEIRHFIALFLSDMPSYMGLGFECRDPHPAPAPNEHYTKLYVFQLKEGPKSTQGPYEWGSNRRLYARIVRQKQLAENIYEAIADASAQWLIRPDAAGQNKVCAWTQKDAPRYIFIAHLDTENDLENLYLPLPEGETASWRLIFSTEEADIAPLKYRLADKGGLLIERLRAGEGWVLEAAQ